LHNSDWLKGKCSTRGLTFLFSRLIYFVVEGAAGEGDGDGVVGAGAVWV